VQIGDGRRVAASERRERCGVGEVAALLGAVERFAEAGLVAATRATPAAPLSTVRNGPR